MKIAILGTGSFGTSLAQRISSNAKQVSLLSRNKDVISSINDTGENQFYYPSVKLNKNIGCSSISDSETVLENAEVVIFALPSGVTREVASNITVDLSGKTVLSTSKGIEYPSKLTMSEVLTEVTGNKNVLSFSGPTFADEMMVGSFTCGTFGIPNSFLETDNFLGLFNSGNFRYDQSGDVKGVELCGVLKNIYSIAVGIFDSNTNSNNEHYAFLNLCFKEMNSVLGEFTNDTDLILKFCAFGDFNLTTNSDKSRNRTLGLMVGKGMLNVNEFNPSIIYEGLKSVRAIREKSNEMGLKIPIIEFVNNSLNDKGSVKYNLDKLLKEI